jgi:hypothetical protein
VPPPRPPARGGGRGLIGTIVILILGGVGVIIGAVLVGGVLVFAGSPATCVDRQIVPSSASSNELRAAWRTYGQQAASGNATVTFTEQQVTSRGVEYITEKSVPVEELQVYFCPGGFAEASGEIKILGLKSKVVVRGTLDLSGARPRIQINDVRAGSLPSAVAKPVVDTILDTGNFRTLNLSEPIARLTYGDGTVTVNSR